MEGHFCVFGSLHACRELINLWVWQISVCTTCERLSKRIPAWLLAGEMCFHHAGAVGGTLGSFSYRFVVGIGLRVCHPVSSSALGGLDARQIVWVDDIQWQQCCVSTLREDKAGALWFLFVLVFYYIKHYNDNVSNCGCERKCKCALKRFPDSALGYNWIESTKQRHCLITPVHLSGLQTCLPLAVSQLQ